MGDVIRFRKADDGPTRPKPPTSKTGEEMLIVMTTDGRQVETSVAFIVEALASQWLDKDQKARSAMFTTTVRGRIHDSTMTIGTGPKR